MRTIIGCLLLAASTLHAQQPAAPTDAAARVPTAPYESAFTGYKPFRAQPLAPWRGLNDEVHQAGGHIGIFRGQAVAPPAKPAAHPPEHRK